jgi:hypothetical protein
MNRILSVLCLTALALALAAPAAFGQDNGNDNDNDNGFYPLPTITISTPNFDIRIVGHDWGDGTEIIITDASDHDAAAAQFLGTARAGSDGSFVADVTAPAAEDGRVTLALAGTDSAGAERRTEVVIDAAGPGSSGASADGTAEAHVEGVAASGEAVAAPPVQTADTQMAASLLEGGNSILVAMIAAGALILLLLGIVRRRTSAP